jgi:hypothetical protein
MVVRIICESAELAVECLQAAEVVGLAVEPEVAGDWLDAATGKPGTNPLVVALCDAPSLDQLVELGHFARGEKRGSLLACLGRGAQADWLRQAALDLGVTALSEIEPLIAALCLAEAGATVPWAASTRALNREDRSRLQGALGSGARTGGHLERAQAGMLAWAEQPGGGGRVVGRARDLALAIAALRDTDRDTPRVELSVDVDAEAVLNVLFGPRRALSDPASKAALAPYDLPLPLEELCSSASRASAEANRIGFPVRISLTSPDLRIWDHPDLAVDMVDNAARVRDTFRQLMGQAKTRLDARSADPRARERLLGVMVTATSEAAALLGLRAWPLPRARVGMEIGFADPHGAAAADRTWTVLPSPPAAIERVLRRLQGAELLFRGTAAQRKAHLEAVGEVLLRVAAFVHDRREEVESVEVRPLALLLDGSVEVREACVSVSDAFERSLSLPAGSKTGS